ncbi:MAG: type II toxin-antitoxin system Phd/YefM family antitoxin [Armatimonadota bacterium]
MATVSMTYAREHFAELCERAHFHGETIVIKKGKNERVALIPVQNLDMLEMVDRVIDLARSESALQAVRDGEATVSLGEIQRALGIKDSKKSSNVCR